MVVPGLNVAKWSSDRNQSALSQQVNGDQQTAHTLGLDSTPSILVQGPKGQAQPLVGDQPYSAIEQAIKQVS